MAEVDIKRVTENGAINRLHSISSLQDRYRILAKLASGGVADIYLGIQKGEEVFERFVVIKRIRSQWAGKEEILRMFLNEARTIATLNHPHIVKIFDICRFDDDLCIAMEYVNGETLSYLRAAAKKNNAPIPLKMVCKWVIEACEALHHAHTAQSPDGHSLKLVHRDIDLGNLMLDRIGYTKLIDFGIAETTALRKAELHDEVKGKYNYLAPDVFTQMNIDHRVDIYALGIVLFELCTLSRPFIRKAVAGFAELASRLFSEEIPVPSTIRKGLPAALDGIVAKATARDRDERYGSCAQFAADLHRVADAELGGLPTNMEVKDWFHATFGERISKRRSLEKMLAERVRSAATLAETSGRFTGINVRESLTPSPTPSIAGAPVHYPEEGSFRDLHTAQPKTLGTPDFRVTFTGSPSSRKSRTAVLLGVVALAMLLAQAIVSFFVSEPSGVAYETAASEAPTEENLFVHTDQSGAMLYVDGELLSALPLRGLGLRVLPDKRHLIEVRKPGFRGFSVQVVATTQKERRVFAALEPLAVSKRSGALASSPLLFAVDGEQCVPLLGQDGENPILE